MDTASGRHNYAYDNLYQLKSADYPAGYFAQDQTFNYDYLGNRTTTTSGSTTNYSSNNLNQYTNVGTNNYTYDATGNLTSDGTFTYAYDYENRLISANKTGTAASYKYDPFGRRTEKTIGSATTKFLYDGDQLICEYDNSGNLTAKYIFGLGIDEPISITKGGQSYYYHYDGLGSVTSLTNSTGSTVESYSYDAFGKPLIKIASGTPLTASSIGNRYLFTGREYDAETNLYFYRARYYSPELGRFLQRDPVGYIAGLNLYSYCSNNPINWIDPFGWDKQGNKGDFPGGYNNPPDTTPESPKPEEKPKPTPPADPRPKDPSPWWGNPSFQTPLVVLSISGGWKIVAVIVAGVLIVTEILRYVKRWEKYPESIGPAQKPYEPPTPQPWYHPGR